MNLWIILINKFMDVEVYEGSSTHDNHMFL